MVSLTRDGFPIIEAEAKVTYELAQGATWHRFFEGLRQAKVLANRCPSCQRVLVPPRGFCPRCFVEMDEWVELPQEGVLVGWCLTEMGYFGQPTEPPFVTGVVNLDGADCGFIHLVGGIDLSEEAAVRKAVRNGMRVKVIWNTEKRGCIMDIRHFTPMG